MPKWAVISLRTLKHFGIKLKLARPDIASKGVQSGRNGEKTWFSARIMAASMLIKKTIKPISANAVIKKKETLLEKRRQKGVIASTIKNDRSEAASL